jgi:sortase A
MSQPQPVVAPERPGSSDVVDLRVPSATDHSSPQATTSAPDRTPSTDSAPMSRSRRRRFAVLVVVLLVVLVLVEMLVGFVTHDSRQRHLAFQLTESTTEVNTGQALLNLQIPSISLNEIVVEGAASSELRGGPGHVEESAEIGAEGNAVILGRRSRYGGPFGRLDELEVGATIAVKTRLGEVRLYEVQSVERVETSSRSPVERTDEERLTLVTSGNGLMPERRLMVTATPRDGSTDADPDRDAGDRVALGEIDVRPTGVVPGGLLVWAMIVGLAVVVVIVGRELRRRYRPAVVVVAMSPVVAVLAVVLLYSLDIVLPATL